MAITASDILIKLSTKSGSAGDSLAQSDVNESLGKYISTTQLTSAAANNLFDNVSGAENAASAVDYRCIFVHNAHGDLDLEDAKVYISSQVSGGTSIAIAVDDVEASAIGSSSPQAFEATDESTDPSEGTGEFSAPSSEETALSLGTIPSGFCKAIWIRRTAANSAAVDADGATIVVFGDTAA